MAKIKRLYSNTDVIAQRVHDLAGYIEAELTASVKGFKLDSVSGNFELLDEDIGFDGIDEYADILSKIDFTTLDSAYIHLNFKSDESKYSSVLTGFLVVRASGDGHITLDKPKYEVIDQLFRRIEREFKECELLKYDPESETRENRERKVNECIRILQNFTDFQTRIKEAFADEKAVQNFMFPILKSHFTDLLDEDYVPKVAGYASKPDFSVPSAGLHIECKFLRVKDDYKKIKEELAADVVNYFSKATNEDSLIIFIYNSSNKPIPANYIADLEQMHSVVKKVIISPGMQP